MTEITRLYLKNFSFVDKVLETEELLIDRTNSTNNLVILLGSNGSGKSSTIQELTPSPLEHVMNRVTSRISKDKSGIKELDIIQDKRYLYKIHIDYGNSTKCFIKKYDYITKELISELNKNGNVNSYYEVLDRELGWTKNYINVGYLSSVTESVILMKPTDRNNYISLWMPELSEYLDGYKIASKKVNILKRQIDMLNSDIGKLTSVDYEAFINNLENALKEVNNKYLSILSHITKCTTYNDIIQDISTNELKLMIDKFIFDANELDKERESIIKTSEELSRYSGEKGKLKIENDLLNSEKKNSILEERLSSIENELNTLRNTIEENTIVIDDKETSSYFDISQSLIEIEKEINNIKSLINIKEKENNNLILFNNDITSGKIDSYVKLLEDLNDYYNKITNLIGLEYLRNNNTFTVKNEELINNKYIKEKLMEEAEKEILNHSNRIYALENSTINEDILKFKPSDCNRNCGLINEILRYISPENEISLIKNNLPILFNNKSKIQEELDYILEESHKMKRVNEYIIEVNNKLYRERELLSIFPSFIKDIFAIDDIFLIFNEIPLLYTKSHDIQDYIYLKAKLATLEEVYVSTLETQQMLKIKNNLLEKHHKMLEKHAETAKKRLLLIDEIKKEENFTKWLKTINELLINNRERIESYNLLANNLLSQKENLISLTKKWNIKGQISKVLLKLDEQKIELSNSLNNITSELEGYKSKVSSLNTLEETRDNLVAKLKKLEIIANIWSPKIGYPSWEIEEFLNELLLQTNKDLEAAWGSSLRINDFKIGANEFSISIDRDGTILNDAIECSDGERAILTLAISFAIIEINLRHRPYNVLRLDELNSVLDTERKRSFLDIILNRIKSLDCGTCFIITHDLDNINNIEADLIIFKGAELDQINLLNKNIIFNVNEM
jgi:DNA repair exonuclease SbcCD ATPase subunit